MKKLSKRKEPRRKKQFCFTPSNEFRTRLENYMSVHKITMSSEALTKICDEWISLQKDNLMLRTLLKGKQPPEVLSTKKKIGKLDCLKGLKFKDVAEMEIKCRICASENLELFNRCTDKKEL